MKKKTPTPKPRYIYKSAITGKIVSKKYAEANPNTTFKEKVK